MEKRGKYKVLQNEKIAKDVFKMTLEGNTSAIQNCGQFINIQLDGLYLRRPISICDYDDKTITIIYKVVGEGTDQMSTIEPGKELDILVGLGNGFNTSKCVGEKPLIIGGGVGTPPLYKLCKNLLAEGKTPVVVLGFASNEDVFYEEEFKKLGVDVYVATVDGSYGTKGFVTDVISNLKDYTYFYACGPMPMLKAITTALSVQGQLSLEERMGCGFGACMGCTIKTKNGYKRVCKEGPVFEKEELVWEN